MFVIKNRTDTSEPRANMMCVDLPKKDLLANKLPIVIPPVSPMGSALGRGEFHHPRTKKVKDGSTHGFLVKFEFQIPTEYFSENGQKIADFWNVLTLVSKVEYECRHRVSVETYSYAGKKQRIKKPFLPIDYK
ncbi:MAG: hypothetical protein K6C34_04940 [Alphaproteobacteria bacterium]|nr:hypothetical protein [Alphaproteobacteria bacterium]